MSVKCGKWLRLPSINTSIYIKREYITNKRVCRVCRTRIDVGSLVVVVKNHSSKHYHLGCFLKNSLNIIGFKILVASTIKGEHVLCLDSEEVYTRNKWDAKFLNLKVSKRFWGSD